MNQFFITGGAGFIGANLVKYLLDKKKCNITVFDNLSTGSEKNLKRAIRESSQKGKVKLVRGDILDSVTLLQEIKGHDATIHLAAHTNVVESLKNPQTNYTVNSTGTFNVLEAARKNRIKKFIFASSNAAVGEQIPPINEKMVPRPISPYGASKLCGEALCSSFFHSYEMKTVSLRFANAYGPFSEHKTSVVAHFLKNAKQGKTLTIFGDGNQTRDFIHAQDICQAIGLILEPQHLDSNFWGGVFQIATGLETKIIDLAKMIQKLMKKNGLTPPEIIFEGERKGEIRINYSDISKARQKLKFNPSIDLSDGLKEMITPSSNT